MASDHLCAYKGPSQQTNTAIFSTGSAFRTSPVHMTPQHHCIFQHDHSPVHTAKKVDRLLQQRGVTVLMWLSQSADLNVIENVWGRMKSSLSRLRLHGKSADGPLGFCKRTVEAA
ncbi:hypothetical protein MTO96_037774 [Rhipicephalus appendiculatus]